MSRGRSVHFRGLVVVFAAGLCLLFQNCSGGFRSTDGDSENPLNQGPQGGPSPDLKVISARGNVFEPLKLTVDIADSPSFPQGLPIGVVFDGGSRELRWIPAKAQAGRHEISVNDGSKAAGKIVIEANAASESSLTVNGPPVRYRDGDVGYVFVHGAGSVDRCANRADLNAYWGQGAQIIAPDPSTRFLACYDGRKAVADVARDVARQILSADCGRFNRCILITHSMGGLLVEHMFLHTRAPGPADPFPQMYADRALYQEVKDRTLFVISLASSAGGSKTANIVAAGGADHFGQEIIGEISRWFGADDDSTRNVVVEYASRIVAPFTEDPGVPFFMVPTYSTKTLIEERGAFAGIWDVLWNDLPPVVFNGNRELALVDTLTEFQARSDGLVEFRSSCGIASDEVNAGPGRSVPLDHHFRYCWSEPKKANHYVWFISNMNHFIVTGPSTECQRNSNPCLSRFPDASIGSYSVAPRYTGLSAVEVIRDRLGAPPASDAGFWTSLVGREVFR